MRTRTVADKPATLHSALLELSTAFELEPEPASEGGSDAPQEGGKKSGGDGAAAKCSCCLRPCKCGTICGIYGCSLPNRHTGMCELPDGGTCSRRRSLTTRAEVDDPPGEPFEELPAVPPLAYAGEEEEEDAVMGDDGDEDSQPTHCQTHPQCIRGFKHGGRGGRCSLEETPCERHPQCVRGFKHGGRGGHCSLRKEDEPESSEAESEEEEEEEARARGAGRSASSSAARFGRSKLCGTFGCTLPDRHNGLHET